MDFQEKSLKVKIPVQTPIISKPEKEGEEEDGFTTPKGDQFRIPPQLECPPAPGPGIRRKTIDKRRKKSAGRRLISVNVQDLDTLFTRTHT
ncbi:unnamed protein product [Microthlaspi erraticum]|uniref:Uncharacterized protein n=1 Tax=Microthlaspi erraticum TaxID=1685480 RepID=A0A6D2I5X7_9BRAS|nr:unnamed protein product [Microthlaspi erraticum]